MGLMSIPARLNSADTWQTRDGQLLKISEMDTRHLGNVKNWLERNAASYHASYLFDSNWAIVPDDVPAEVTVAAVTDSVVWIKQQPVYQAVAAELNRREGIEIRLRPKTLRDLIDTLNDLIDGAGDYYHRTTTKRAARVRDARDQLKQAEDGG